MDRVLIVEDEAGIASFVEKGLRAAGYVTMVVGDGRSGSEMARSGAFELVILDLGLPDRDGLEVLSEIRRSGSEVPVIVLTARDDTSTVVDALDRGASDHITKPFSFEELLARVRARLRAGGRAESPVLVVGEMSLDLRSRTVTVGASPVDLTAREFALAETFFRHPGQVMSRQQLADRVWGYDFDTDSNVVEVYVGYLRRKLGRQAIETVRNMGYRLRA
ncbi:MAG: response regulator transcription factor [Acidimicrobiales bacterium]